MSLRSEMAEYGVKVKDIAKAIGVSIGTASLKVNRKSEFTVDQAVIIRDSFFPTKTLDELFSTHKKTAFRVEGGSGN